MRLIKVFDKKDYESDEEVFARRAARAVILKDGRLALLHGSKYGDYKFPGGGVDEGETKKNALVREVMEETGLKVVRGSIRDFGRVKELRKSRDGRGIYRHISFYYLCDVEDEIYPTSPEQYEIDFGYELVYADIDTAIAANENLKNPPGWTARDTWMMGYVKKEVARR